MVDAPGNVSSLEVVIKRIDVDIAGKWVTIAYPNQPYELLDLQLDPVTLANAGVAEGSYTKIRVAIASALVNQSVDVTVPSDIQTDGLEIPVMFDMESSHRTTLLMDFNVEQSLKILPGGGYLLDPVINTVVKADSGTVSGFVTLLGQSAEGTRIEAEYMAGPNYPVGTIVNTARAQADGYFLVWALLPGEYKLNLVRTSPTGDVSKAVVPGVIVDAGSDTPVGEISLN
jgi:hypothetical protein